ncbi:MAG: hypothetical protein IKW90_01315 [Lachnospiraceae bacterium]|nr:hypothetical protein [Lachnospiraceae bacterium]
MKKLVAVVIFVGVLLFNSIPVYADSHPNPAGGYCVKTERYWTENGLANYYVGTHEYINGYCTVYYYRISHRKHCGYCGAIISDNVIFPCTENHTNCSFGYIKGCTAPFND